MQVTRIRSLPALRRLCQPQRLLLLPTAQRHRKQRRLRLLPVHRQARVLLQILLKHLHRSKQQIRMQLLFRRELLIQPLPLIRRHRPLHLPVPAQLLHLFQHRRSQLIQHFLPTTTKIRHRPFRLPPMELPPIICSPHPLSPTRQMTLLTRHV